MTNRFRFDLENGDIVIRDEIGVEADDISQAVEQALAGIDEMRASGELVTPDDLWTLVIRDEDGAELKRIRL